MNIIAKHCIKPVGISRRNARNARSAIDINILQKNILATKDSHGPTSPQLAQASLITHHPSPIKKQKKKKKKAYHI
jgi:hypothetical protein